MKYLRTIGFSLLILGVVAIVATTSLRAETQTSSLIHVNVDQKPQNNRGGSQTMTTEQQSALNHVLTLIEIPENYSLSQIREGIQNKERVFVFRYTKQENNQLGGEHFSFTVTEENQLLGVTWMDQKFQKGSNLPSKEKTTEIVRSYLSKVEPDLFKKLENLWIEPHDEIIQINNKNVTVTGIKYKCFIPSEDSYAWVIVGPNEQVITFERGIQWAGMRLSEKWLHDAWLIEK